jgi:beta-N-acetylhexosaminidase
VVGDLLRGELGYEGLVVADDLEMGGAGGAVTASAAALAAGCDMLLVCRSRQRMRAVRDHLLAEIRAGRVSRQRIGEAAARVDSLRRASAALPTRRLDSALAALVKRFGAR